MDALVLKNRKDTFGEILTDFDFGSFKYEYEKNNERSISFTIFKTTQNTDIFENLLNEMLLQWQGQDYVIKSTSIQYDGAIVSNEVMAKHVFMEFQNHYINKDIESEEINNEEDNSEGDEAKPTMTLKQYLDFGFKDNELGFTYQIKGKFDKRVVVDELGEKNGMEYLSEGAELFDYIYFADNKKILIYDTESFYEMAGWPLIYKYNSDELDVQTTTTDIRTYIQGYGKKKDKQETKNYNPMKPKNLSYSGAFIKEGTWRTEKVGASYSKEFTCKWGNERLEWTLKKGSKGGLLDVYLDGNKTGSYECYNKNAVTENIIIAQNLSKGKHTFKAVFRGAKSGVDYKKSNPCMYVQTEKSKVLDLTAVLKGKDVYHVYADYESPNKDTFGLSEAPTVFDDNVLNKDDLLARLKEELNDQPTVEVSTNYLGSMDDKHYLTDENIQENHKIHFIHKPVGLELDLEVVKLTKSYPLLRQPAEVEFSNSAKDIIKIQQQTSKNIKQMNKLFKGGSLSGSSFSMPQLASESIGSVMIE
ncbi:MAG: phage tail protein [Tetragenococcus koreensis]|nr:phage tail protein [Tetragenococcus koreensis]MDN6423307.1 phage tail protein [Tetragenococcus koreensis]